MENIIGPMAINYEFVFPDVWERQSFVYLFLQSFVAKRHQEFIGNGQHDAQELLTVLLDAIHEVKKHVDSFGKFNMNLGS